jgi:biopolymer transport protein ExbD
MTPNKGKSGMRHPFHPRGSPLRRGKPRPADDDGQVTPDINTTPLIDVMLVLLVMLLITVPLQHHAVTLASPTPAAVPPPPPTDPAPPLRLTITADGMLRWDGAALGSVLDAGREPLALRLRELAGRTDAPELQIQPEPATPYGMVAHVLAASRRAGVGRIGVADTATTFR